MLKIAFVTHEFGLFKGHGGIASYLYLVVAETIKRVNDCEIHILTLDYDKKDSLLNEKNVFLTKIKGDGIGKQGRFVRKYFETHKIDIVESTDYLALCLESLIYKKLHATKSNIAHTTFVTMHHTASRECFEWSSELPVKFAPYFVRECFMRERTQMKLSDINVSPSQFLQNYVMKNYNLDDIKLVYHPFKVVPTVQQEDDLTSYLDISQFTGKFIVNCISRIEGRKNQLRLVEQFELFLERTQSNSYLFIIGNNTNDTVTGVDMRFKIYEKIKPAHRQNILFFDFMKAEEKEQILSISSLTVLASTFENAPMSMTESITNKVPVMVSKYCGFSDYMTTCKETMSFDPFKEDDLSKKVELFYNLSDSEKESVVKEQYDNLLLLADFKNTIEGRYKLYSEHSTKKMISCNTLILNHLNCYDLVDESFIHKSQGVMVHFYFSKEASTKLCSFFETVVGKFEKGEILTYPCEIYCETVRDALNQWVPFYIVGDIFTEEHVGLTIMETIKRYLNVNSWVFPLFDEPGLIKDSMDESVTEHHIKNRNIFKNSLLDHLFIEENKLNMEDRYAE